MFLGFWVIFTSQIATSQCMQFDTKRGWGIIKASVPSQRVHAVLWDRDVGKTKALPWTEYGYTHWFLTEAHVEKWFIA